MNEIYPVAKLGYQILIINKDDLLFVGKEMALEVKCIKVDLRHKVIDPPIELEKHLKFNPWEEITDKEREVILQELGSKFSDEEILGKIMEPLVKSLIKSLQ
ncbi:MAG: hypothetical protein UT37_C0005G0010 [Parcubacteria group bacterium GW2011_GWA2_39_18]|nr:MAG: hypothetical protein UT37_C0005G0010 [Parcubacteria group bacterium GW2011_GWA2_39_18]